jgi:hypothetical protein
MTEQEPPNLEQEAIKLSEQGKEPYQIWIELAKIYGSEAVAEYLELQKLLGGEDEKRNK